MCRFKGRNAGQIAGNSCSIAKICNDEAANFSPKMLVQEYISGSLRKINCCDRAGVFTLGATDLGVRSEGRRDRVRFFPRLRRIVGSI
jgi:hypothetical protein